MKLSKWILPLIPEHSSYIEPFCGGATIFWYKELAKKSVINDINNFVMNFYMCLKDDFDSLNDLVQKSLHSRNLSEQAKLIYKNPDEYSKLEQAWAFWYGCHTSIMSQLGNGFLTTTNENRGNHFDNKKVKFTQDLSEKLNGVTLECRDSLDIIRMYDLRKSFLFLRSTLY